MPQQLRFSGAVSGALDSAIVPVCGKDVPTRTFELAITGKIDDRIRVSVSLDVKGFGAAGTYSFDQGRGFVLVYGPPRTTYYVGSSSLARSDTLTVDPGDKTGTVSVGFYNRAGGQQPVTRLIGTWRCQG